MSSVRDLVVSAPVPCSVRLLVDGIPRAVYSLRTDEDRARVLDELQQQLASVPTSSAPRVEVAEHATAPALAMVALAAPVPAATIAPASPPFEMLRHTLSATEGLGRLGLAAIAEGQRQQTAILDRFARENERAFSRIASLETRLTEAWERSQGSAAELDERRAKAAREDELLRLAGTVARMVVGSIAGGAGRPEASAVARVEAVRRAFASATPDTLAPALAVLDEAQRAAVMNLLSPDEPGEEAEPVASPKVSPMAVVALANRRTK